MANAWRRDKSTKFLTSKSLLLLFLPFLALTLLFFSSRPSTLNPNPNYSFFIKSQSPQFRGIEPFDCFKSPQAHPVIANVVEGVKYPFLYALSDLGSLPDKPHKNIVRLLKNKPFRKPDISATIQGILERIRDEAGEKISNGVVIDVGANVGMASFAAAVMGFRVLAFEPILENLQRICDGIYFNRVGELVTVFEADASDQLGNITVHKFNKPVTISLNGVRDKNIMQLKKLNVTLFPVRYNDKYYAAALASGDVSKLGIPSATTDPLSSAAWLSEPSQLATSLPTTTAHLRFWSMLPHTGRMEEQVEVLQEKLKHTEEEVSIGGKRTKMARSQGKKIHITAEQEYSRLTGE